MADRVCEVRECAGGCGQTGGFLNSGAKASIAKRARMDDVAKMVHQYGATTSYALPIYTDNVQIQMYISQVKVTCTAVIHPPQVNPGAC